MGETKIGRFDVEFDGHMFVLGDVRSCLRHAASQMSTLRASTLASHLLQQKPGQQPGCRHAFVSAR